MKKVGVFKLRKERCPSVGSGTNGEILKGDAWVVLNEDQPKAGVTSDKLMTSDYLIASRDGATSMIDFIGYRYTIDPENTMYLKPVSGWDYFADKTPRSEPKWRGMTPNGEWVYGPKSTVLNKVNTMGVDGSSIGQYTGIKDKNGIEVYEKGEIEFEGVRHSVFYNERRESFVVRGIGSETYLSDIIYFSVVK